MTDRTQKTTFRQAFTSIIWPRRCLLIVGLVLIVVNRLAGMVLPGSTKFLVDDVILRGDRQLLTLITIAILGALIIQATTSLALTRLLSVEAQHLISLLRLQVQKHIIRLPIHFFDDTKSGELVSRIMTDVEGVRNLVGTGLVQMVGGVLTATIALGFLININARLTLCVLLPLSLFAIVSLRAFRFIRPVFRERGRINADVTGRLTESLAGIRVIKGFNAEEHEVQVFAEGVNRIFRNVSKSLMGTSLVTSCGTLLVGAAGAGIIWLGGMMIIDGTMTVGDLVAFFSFLAVLVAPIVQMGNIGSQITEAFAGLDRTEEILAVPIEEDDERRQITLGDFAGNLTFENVTFCYRQGIIVVRNASFTAAAGTVTALVGSSGSGKSTIAGLAASFLTPTDGVDLSTVKLSSYRSRLGVVLQDSFLFDGTIRENIRFANPNAGEEELREAAAAAYVKEFVERFENGLDTLIGERGVKLSGGQRQRVAIARALLANPRILIFDEATSSLDAESERYIQKSLGRLMEGRTTIVIAHRLSTIQRANQILVIEDGEIVERGTHSELLAKEGRYHSLYTYQARI